MTDTPKISIIVPIFNGGNYVDSCLDGIEKQDFQDYEVCFVIDHKTAGLKEIFFVLRHQATQVGVAPDLGFDPGDELQRIEGLRDVIVSSYV